MDNNDPLQAFYSRKLSYDSVMYEGSITKHLEAEAAAPGLLAEPVPAGALFQVASPGIPEDAPRTLPDPTLASEVVSVPPPLPPVFAPSLFPTTTPRAPEVNSVSLFPTPAPGTEANPTVVTPTVAAPETPEAAKSDEGEETEKTADGGKKKKRRQRNASDPANSDDLDGE